MSAFNIGQLIGLIVFTLIIYLVWRWHDRRLANEIADLDKSIKDSAQRMHESYADMRARLATIQKASKGDLIFGEVVHKPVGEPKSLSAQLAESEASE